MGDTKFFQLITAEWRHRALKILAAQHGNSMTREAEQAIDAHLAANGVPLGDNGQAAQSEVPSEQ